MQTNDKENNENDDEISIASTATNKSMKESGWSGTQTTLLTQEEETLKNYE